MTTILYWLRYDEHTDPETEGYIGVSRKFNDRVYSHKKGYSGKHIFNRINNGASFEILHECDTEEEAYQLEEKYRPEDMIGWNLCKGGGSPPSRAGKVAEASLKTGDDRSEAQKRSSAEHSARMKGKTSPRKGVKLEQSTIDKFTKKMIINGKTYNSYSEAAEEYGVSQACITLWKRKDSKVIKRRNGDILNVEFL